VSVCRIGNQGESVLSGWLTVAVVAGELEVSPRTVLRWIERGDLVAVKLPGGRLRIAAEELAGRLEAWSTPPADERMLAPIAGQVDLNGDEHDADG
jgi:excisionase family DNA binding protein